MSTIHEATTVELDYDLLVMSNVMNATTIKEAL